MYLRRLGVGHLLFASSFAVIGAISLVARDFLLNQQPVPPHIPWRQTLACISAVLMLAPGIGMLFPATAKRSALILTGFVALWVVALQVPRVLAQPLVEASWLGLGEDSTLVAGGWLIFCAIAGRQDGTVRAARILFGLALVPIGLSHFFYLKFAASLIPGWMPLREPLTCLGGAGHIAAGLAVAFAVVPRLAATLEAIMESLFTLICWLSAVVTAPSHRDAWVNLFISAALSAAAWALAASYDTRRRSGPLVAQELKR
ncbi:MAG TPA: hypothetical protein VN735_14485 [Steroidobacteraceae bacterium]|nr:hypothetical protein [Steroidobacteraceae bacterium]